MSEPRTAEVADLEALRRLFERAATSLAQQRGGEALLGATSIGDRLEGLVASGGVRLVEEGGTTCAAVALWREAEVGWIALWVAPEARQRGTGRALGQLALDQLAASGASCFDAIALPGDRATKQLLESLGFKARLLVMRRED